MSLHRKPRYKMFGMPLVCDDVTCSAKPTHYLLDRGNIIGTFCREHAANERDERNIDWEEELEDRLNETVAKGGL